MSINAIGSVSLYEYYYTINRENEKKKQSPLVREMREYGLTPTDDDNLNIALLKRAKATKETNEQTEKEDIPYSSRPWADIMYQLNIPFNKDPSDDIEDIKAELAKLTVGFDDEELSKEIKDLEKHVEGLYLNFQQIYSNDKLDSASLGAQLNNLSVLNQVNLL